ncbi:hypothetical protein D6T64_05115 [Cryobacterium melibiosiphilum]|uniref:DUF8175 domain-containing protein n=1 Tax=Cryobacterium melibiosiphilum TaxID=995039 RepID=A0A3A5MM16_9MICO|nr:hypothetical protein [Cryobacterium melibiosiphilum]RJT90045.1 hypothetical protein D6T64_05115 [Cryobacterium melibiosiphilum]
MTNTEQRSPLSRPGFVAAAIVVGIIALASIIVLVTSLTRGSDDNNAQPTEDPSTSSTPGAEASDESVCGLSGLETESALTAAPTNEWELVGSVAAPTDPEGSGPGATSDQFRTCFAHTAEGALFAAVNSVAASTDSRNSSRMWELLADGPAKDTVKAAGEQPTSTGNTRLQVAGFKVNNYSADEATIDVAYTITSEGGALVSYPTVLRWEAGDWKVVVTETGAPIAPGPLSNLGGYIPWSGV